MNIIYTNTDISNAREHTKYPFTQQSTCILGNVLFNTSCIKSLSICVQSARFPLFIDKIKRSSGTVILQITSLDITFKAFVYVTPNSSIYLIKNTYDQIVGTVAVQQQDSYMYNFFNAYLTTTAQVQAASDAFILAPECIKCINYEALRYLKAGDYTLKRKANIYFGNNCYLLAEDDNISINVAGDLDMSYKQIKKLKTIKVTNEDIGETVEQDLASKNIILKHTMLSDLRVVTKQDQILLTGVMDVS